MPLGLQNIGVGTVADDGTGDNPRAAALKINANNAAIIAALADDPAFAATVAAALAGKQPLDTDLTAIAALTTTAYGRGVLTMADASALLTALDVSAFIKTLLDDADAPTARATLGAVIGTDVQAYSAMLAKLAVPSPSASKIIRLNASSDAELIDWILDGSWTPTIDCSSNTDLSVSYSAQVGTWHKRGRDVSISGVIGFTPTYSTSSGNVRIGGWPFAADVNTAVSQINFSTLPGITWPSAITQIFVTPQSGLSYAHITGHKSAGATQTAQLSTFPSGTAVTIRFRGVYSAAS